MNDVELKRNAEAIRVLALNRQKYFSRLFLNMQIVFSESVPAMAIDDYLRVYINPSIFTREGWNVPSIATVYAHEAAHVWRRHSKRVLSNEFPWAAAMAKEAAINGALNKEGFPFPLKPDGEINGVLPSNWDLPVGWSEEQFFEALKKYEPPHPTGNGQDGEKGKGGDEGDETSGDSSGDESQNGESTGTSEKQGQGEGQSTANSKDVNDHGSGSDGKPRPWDLPPDDPKHPAMGNTQLDVLMHQVAQDIIDAASSGIGNIPGNILEFAKEMLDSKVPWQTQIRNHLVGSISGSRGLRTRTYSRPHRRQMGAICSGDVIRAGHRMLTPRIGVVTDTSGSMSLRFLQQTSAEVGGIAKAVGASVLHIQWDTQAHLIENVRNLRHSGYIYRGRGGTDMGAAIEFAAKQRCDIIIVLTDGFTPWPDERDKPKQAVIAGILAKDIESQKKYVRESCPKWIRLVGIEVGDKRDY